MTSPIPFMGAFGGGQSPSFNAPLITTLVPNSSGGDSTPTYTRATTAYVTDFEGLLKQVPSGCARFSGARFVRNLLIFTEELDNAAWNKSNVAPAASGDRTAPNGTLTAFLCAPSGTALLYQGVILSSIGSHVFSIWVRSATGADVTTSLFANGSGVSPNPTQANFTATTAWKRVSINLTIVGTTVNVGIGNISGGNNWSVGEDLYVWGAQLEETIGQTITAPSEYVSVGVLSAPYHGAGVDGVKYFDTENGNSVASNVVTEATGAAIADATLKGYLAEGQRQNRCIYAQDFSNAAWVSGGGGIAVTPNTAVAPDGTTTADTLTASGANGTLIQDLGVVASAAKAGGMWLKRKTGTGNIDLTLDGGSTWTTVAVTSDWLLLEKTQTLADEDFGIRIVTSGDAVYAWTAQVETAAFISSPIPTTTAAVTRNADVLTYASSGNLLGTAGTVYVECCWKAAVAGTGMVCNATTNRVYVFRSGLTLQQYDGTTAVNGPSVLATQPTLQKQAGSWGGSSMVSASAGVLGTPGSFDGDMNADANFTIGWRGAGAGGESHLFGSVRNVRIWTKALPDATLQSITT